MRYGKRTRPERAEVRFYGGGRDAAPDGVWIQRGHARPRVSILRTAMGVLHLFVVEWGQPISSARSTILRRRPAIVARVSDG
jgi:hypothetical protein